jgi:hypothetical protein
MRRVYNHSVTTSVHFRFDVICLKVFAPLPRCNKISKFHASFVIRSRIIHLIKEAALVENLSQTFYLVRDFQ